MALTNTNTNPFWEFSLGIYAQAGVADACLALQESDGVDINLLLYCCWRARLGIYMSSNEVKAVNDSIAAWRTEVVHPIRALRQGLREYPGVASCRELIKAAELESERLQQEQMFAGAMQIQDTPRDKRSPGAGEDALAHNLAQFATFQGISAAGMDNFDVAVRAGLRNLPADLPPS